MQSVDDLKLAQEIKNKQEVRLFNPLDDDFTVRWHGKPLTVNALEITVLPRPEAEHIKKHLIDYIINQRSIHMPTEKDRKAIAKEIEVEL